ncbi:hypothetical protein E8803_RS24390 [Escherichia coli]|nr:hypothetical protein [Escherichia coli]EEC8083929.1 hypothetical protein [Escherichia coli]
MIFLKNGESFIRVNDWSEIQARKSYYPKLELNDQQLSDVFGYYDDLPEEIPCGKSNCRKGHKKGFLVVTKDGFETNIGHVCGTNVFGIAFDNLAIELCRKADFHRLLTALKEAKDDIFSYYKLKAKIESGRPSLTEVAHRILDMKDPKIIGRAAYQTLKKMAASGDGRVFRSRLKNTEELELDEIMSQKQTSDLIPKVNNKNKTVNELIGVIQYPECLLNDYDIALLYERDIKMVLEKLNKCTPDELTEREVLSFGIKVSRLRERFNFVQERLEKSRIFATRENLKPLRALLNIQKSVSNKDKLLFKKFMENLP